MQVGVLSDIHGNEVALNEVLSAMPDVDAVVNAGDVVGYNPMPKACLDRIRDVATVSVMGNHDRAVATGTSFRFNHMAKAGVEHAEAALDEGDIGWLRTLPDEATAADGRIRVVHGHPDDPDHYTYPEEFSPDLLTDEAVLVMGHTHHQHAETYDDGIVLNPGSVGQPRDGDPRAAFAVLDLDEMTVDLRRVSYDIQSVQAAVEAAGLPRAIGDRLEDGN